MAKQKKAKRKTASRKKTSHAAAKAKVFVLVGTRKGAFVLRSDSGRKKWKLEGPHFLGCIIHHLVLDPRDGKTLMAACRTGHLGPTIYRSADFGKTWTEAAKPPAFQKTEGGR